MHHITPDDLERYHFDHITGSELEIVEEHLLWCQDCLDTLEATERFIALVRAGVIRDGVSLMLNDSGSLGGRLTKRNLKYAQRSSVECPQPLRGV